MVELPDDLIEVAVAAAYEASFDEKNTWQMLIRTAVEAAGPLIAARVRAEAVADERQRIVEALRQTFPAWAHDSRRGNPDQVGYFATLDRVAEVVAAGSVPVATPPSEWPHVVVMPGRLTDKTLLEALGLTAAEQAEARGRLRAELDRIDRAERGAPSGPVATSTRPRRYDQCDGTCTVDCGHCKGDGSPVATPPTCEAYPRDGRVHSTPATGTAITVHADPVATPTEPPYVDLLAILHEDDCEHGNMPEVCARCDEASPVPAEQPDGWGEGSELADHPVGCKCSPCVIGRLQAGNDALRDELRRAADEIDRLRAEQPEER